MTDLIKAAPQPIADNPLSEPPSRPQGDLTKALREERRRRRQAELKLAALQQQLDRLFADGGEQ